jgi:hypothetical protein
MRRSTIAFGRSAVLDEHLGPNPHPPHMSATNIMVALLYRTGKGEAPPAQPCGVGACQRVEKYSFRCKARSLTLRKSGFRRRGPAFKTEADWSRLCYAFRDTSSGSWRVAKRTAVTKPAQNHPPGHVAAHDTPGRITSTSENL